MKKLLVRLTIAALALLILAAVCIALFMDNLVKRGVDTVGPLLTKVEVKLDSASLSLLSGSGKLKGLFVGNPSGFKSPSAIQVGTASLAIAPGSVFSSKVIIRSINVQAPEITFETDFKGNNLSKILANVESFSGSSSSGSKQENNASRKLQVDDFLISGGKIHVSVTALGGQSATVALPEIHLTGLGQGPDGITVAELTKVVLNQIEKQAAQVAAGAIADLGKNATGLTKDLGNTAADAAGKVTKGLGGLLKKN
ncbi:MAG TPA: hypothetical protein VKY92_14955 [Verrucomicrobiae bacterium]|nr:hypothetical protein [Verrucomicrobiae bacterium]